MIGEEEVAVTEVVHAAAELAGRGRSTFKGPTVRTTIALPDYFAVMLGALAKLSGVSVNRVVHLLIRAGQEAVIQEFTEEEKDKLREIAGATTLQEMMAKSGRVEEEGWPGVFSGGRRNEA